MIWRCDSAAVSVWVDKKRCCWWQPEFAVQHLNTYYKCKNNYEDNLAIQNEIFKIKYMISTLAVSKWKLCLHNVLKRVDGNNKKCCQ